MSTSPHLYMLAKAMRSKSLTPMAVQSAVRGGGGGFHKPDPQPFKPYNHTRVVALEDINTVLYHDSNPEYHLHLHAMWVKNSKQGWLMFWCLILGVICPLWALAAYTHKRAGSNLTPSLRPGKDHAHMAPKLINHLRENNYENGKDFIGRRNGMFYKNYMRQMNEIEYKPNFVRRIENHGFKF